MAITLRCYMFVVIFFCVCPPLRADLIYTIGNSLTYDTRPQLLDGDVDWHIYCAKNLQYIFNNPDGHCVSSSTPWTTALVENQYDWITVQPHAGTTLSQDIAVISHWMAMQPDANFVIHTAWTRYTTFPNDYQKGNPDNKMRPSPEYYDALIEGLNDIYPHRKIGKTRTNEMLFSIWTDIQNGIGPFDSLSDLYRDEVHMGYHTGRYLAHNSLRLAIGQEISANGFNVDPEIKAYLDGKLAAFSVPEPGTQVLLVSAIAGLVMQRRRRR